MKYKTGADPKIFKGVGASPLILDFKEGFHPQNVSCLLILV
jgi:hypothetical protein